MKIDLKIFI